MTERLAGFGAGVPVILHQDGKDDAAVRQKRDRELVVVLGMHRSGTSLCSHLLSMLGVDMADEIGAGKGNEKGHWERWEIVRFHDTILGFFDREYSSGFHDFPLPAGWWAHPEVVRVQHDIEQFLSAKMGPGLIGFKDPRTLRMLPMWRQVFANLRLTPKFVMCLRNPAQVARSLRDRDGLAPRQGEIRWLIYMSEALRHLAESEVCMIEYERWFTEPLVNYGMLSEFLGVASFQNDADLDICLGEIIDNSLRHDSSLDGPNEPVVATLYGILKEGHCRGQIRSKAGRQVLDACNLIERVLRPFGDAFVERERGLKALAGEAEFRALKTVNELEQQRSRLAELDAQLAAQDAAVLTREQELRTIRAEVGEAETRAAELLKEVEQQRSVAGQHQLEICALKERLVECEHALSGALERAAEFEKRAAEMQREVDAQRTLIAEMPQTAGSAGTRLGDFATGTVSDEAATAELLGQLEDERARSATLLQERAEAVESRARAEADLKLMRHDLSHFRQLASDWASRAEIAERSLSEALLRLESAHSEVSSGHGR